MSQGERNRPGALGKDQGQPHAGIAYSDGDEPENRLLALLKACRDPGTASVELSAHIEDWPSQYHLSPKRHYLLRAILPGDGQTILELGCGCGAITRYLGEAGATVLAVEGSARRAEIAAQRCRDLANIHVVCNDLMDFATDRRFDVVTLIGVLEYAPRYIRAKDPMHACLQQAASFLKPDGFLLLAIENRLGLKYFNGCNEDHLGKPYYGLHGLYRKDEPTTLGRAELIDKLIAAGLAHHRFYYPFPDYKLPQAVISDSALGTPGFDIAALLARMAAGNAEGDTHPNFHEYLAWRPLVANGLLPQLANSFLIVAARTETAFAQSSGDFLAVSYSMRRLPGYATETIFRNTSDDRIIAEKRLVYPGMSARTPPQQIAGGTLIHHTGTAADYVPGELYIVELQRRLARGEGLEAVIDWARDWLELVKAALIDDGAHLPGDWLDKIPQNYIRTPGGCLAGIDAEWAVTEPIPLAWVVLRGLMNALAAGPTSPALGGMSLLEAIRRIGGSAGLDLQDAAIDQACALEAELRAIVYGESQTASLERLRRHLAEPPQDAIGGLTAREFYEKRCAALEGEIRRVKSTVSWRITKPLRLMANLPRLIRPFFRQRRQPTP